MKLKCSSPLPGALWITVAIAVTVSPPEAMSMATGFYRRSDRPEVYYFSSERNAVCKVIDDAQMQSFGGYNRVQVMNDISFLRGARYFGECRSRSNPPPISYQELNLSVTASAYAEGCGLTGGCQRATDTQYLGIPPTCVQVGSHDLVSGDTFGRTLKRVTTLPRGSQINDAEYQAMSQSDSFRANLSVAGYGRASGDTSSNFASRNDRTGTFVTNVDIIRLQVEAVGRRATWRGPGSKGEYTLSAKLRCKVQ